ncbi:UNVERIFIED_CONTAM: hypothetical protein Sindi_2938700 [Sesamum indicum]
MADDGLVTVDEGDTMPMAKDPNLDGKDGDLVRRPKLGFGGAPSTSNNGERRTAIGVQSNENSAALRDGVFSSGSFISGDIGGRTKAETANTRVSSRPVTFPTRSIVFRPVKDAIPTNSKVTQIHDDAAGDVSIVSADVSADSADVSADSADVSADSADDVIVANTGHDISNVVEKNSNFGKKIASSPLFIGNIPLHTSPQMNVDDKITVAFNNSSRKTLSYIALTMQNGEVVVRPSLDTVRDGAKQWETTAVGYFLGKRPYYHHLKEFAFSVWPALREVTATTNGFFFFRFKSVIDMEEVIEGGPWLFQGQPIVLQKWEPGMAMRKLKHTQVPLWIKVRHFPMEFWTTKKLSTVASGVGKRLYPDAITRACTRLDFAGVCVMIDVTQTLRKHIIIMTPDEDGGETPCKVDVEYAPLYGRLRTKAAHGDGGKSSDYGCFSEPWWTTGLEMGGISSCGRIRGTILALFVTLSHEDRG